MQTKALPPGHKVKFQAPSGPESRSRPSRSPPVPATSPLWAPQAHKPLGWLRKALTQDSSLMPAVFLEHCVAIFFKLIYF